MAAALYVRRQETGGALPTKLLARKRPHLLPVYGQQVAQVQRRPHGVWACLGSWYHESPDRAVAIRELRAEVDGVEDISLLRCLDVVLWMRGGANRPVGMFAMDSP